MITCQMLPTQVLQSLQFLVFSEQPPWCLASLPRCLVCSPDYDEDFEDVDDDDDDDDDENDDDGDDDIQATPLIGRPDCEDGR